MLTHPYSQIQQRYSSSAARARRHLYPRLVSCLPIPIQSHPNTLTRCNEHLSLHRRHRVPKPRRERQHLLAPLHHHPHRPRQLYTSRLRDSFTSSHRHRHHPRWWTSRRYCCDLRPDTRLATGEWELRWVLYVSCVPSLPSPCLDEWMTDSLVCG